MADPKDDELPEDERVEVTVDDDETVTDPVEDPEGDTPDDDTTDTTDDDAEPDDGDDEGEPEPQQGRAARRIAALNDRARQTAEENARLTRELDELRRRPVQPVETPAQRADRLALMSPEERIREEVNDALRVNEQKTQALTSQIMEQSDRASFEAQAAANPILKKLAPEVERRLGELRRGGQNLPRSVVATYIIGERALQQANKAKPAREERRRQQTTRPVNGRGDVATNRRRTTGDTATDIEQRFGDVPI